MFRPTTTEAQELVTNCDRFHYIKHLAEPPHAFTEHGALQAANILNSERAIEMSVFVVRAFVRLRELALTHKEFLSRLNQLEQKCDSQFKVVFDALRQLMMPPISPHRRIGFQQNGSHTKEVDGT
jgi:hypothetical protein